MVLDYRCPTVFGDIPLVFLKERPIGKRFDNLNTRVRMAEAKACFNDEELAQIKEFCAAMDLDWGGLDILRHAADNKIYIVDVNKTDMGPPLSLPIKDKLSAVKTLGQALRDRLEERLQVQASSSLVPIASASLTQAQQHLIIWLRLTAP